MATRLGFAHGGVQWVLTALVLGACGNEATTSTGGAAGDAGRGDATAGSSGAESGVGGMPSIGGAGGSAGTQSSGAGGASGGTGGVPSGGAGASGSGTGAAGASGGAAAAGAGASAGVGASGAGAGAGGTGGDDASGSAGDGATAGDGSEPLSFAEDIWPTFAEIRDPAFVYPTGDVYEGCTTIGVCHGGQNPGANLHMPDARTAYDDLLNVPSVSRLCDQTIRVVPGNPAESCLILFYEGRLRDELDWVDDTEIDLVRRWIADGALP